MNPAFWRGKRVFLTGHTGFKGSWLSLWLQQLGAKLTGFALAPLTNPSLFELASVSDAMRSIEGDVRDLEMFKAAMLDAKPDIVIHMAAQPLVRDSYQNPVDTFTSNVMGTVHMFEAIRATPSVRAVVNITTDKCYEIKEWIWGYREDEPMGGHDPYSASKACAELVSSSYRTSFFQPDGHKVAMATARAGNVIGGGDWAKDRLMTDLIIALTTSKPLLIRNPNAIRPWQHVLEPLRGYLMLAEKLFTHGGEYAEAWNFGPNDQDAKPVSWLTERLTQFWGGNSQWQMQPGNHPHEANYLKLDISKVKTKLGWSPSMDLEQTLRLTAEWAQQVAAGADARMITLEQIQTYQDEVIDSREE
ncbi:CDP-glucose 4,6-dehydratase [Litoricolaceae bacterium]|nr:CDP-glucose 4,6-dehydratase [Litorivicinaceae bacterium]